MFSTRKLTEDGLETTFALNHMAYFVVTHGLRERLVASAPARVVSTASAAHQGASLDFDDLQLAESFGAKKAYGCSKLCNILFTRELVRRLHGTGVIANCLHPGFVATRFGDESGGLISRFAGLAKLLAISPEKGAETIIYLASSPKIAATTGQYFYKCRPITPSREAQDDRTALSLWEHSAALAGLMQIKHLRTKPYTPKTNGKAERFIQTALREWAYARAYRTSDQRAAELPIWTHQYNWHRPHGSLKSNPPISRLAL
jgi:hypothetical protein